MKRARVGVLGGSIAGLVFIGACALDESGTVSDGGADVVVRADGGPDVIAFDAPVDVTYDVPDLGVGETEAGLPCTCVGTPPNGYAYVEYVPAQQPACTTGYATQTDTIEDPTAAASTCSCACGSTFTTPPTCACGADPAMFDLSTGHSSCSTYKLSVNASVGSCYTTPQVLAAVGQGLDNIEAAPHTPCTPSTGTCGSGTATAAFPPATASQGRACMLSAAPSTCTGGTCVPTQGAPFALCATDHTMAACPSSFPVSHIVGSNPIVDTRGCGPGACGCSVVDAGACGVPQLSLFSGDPNCGLTGSSVVIPADNATCTSAGYGNGTTFTSARYTITQSGGACGFTGTFNPTGGLSVTGPYRVCCRP